MRSCEARRLVTTNQAYVRIVPGGASKIRVFSQLARALFLLDQQKTKAGTKEGIQTVPHS